jgi:hypothetical protein
MDKLINPVSEIKYAVPSNNLVWIVHLVVAIAFLAVGAVYYYYKDKDDKDIIKNMDQGIYTLLMVLGGLMLIWHGHLFTAGNGLFSKIGSFFQ